MANSENVSMKIRESVALTFDDVLMVPQYSAISSRGAVSTTTRLTPKIECAIPIVSANMDTVTEASMAVVMARTGGLGIIHRFLSPERQAQEISRVKRAESFVVAEPLTVSAGTPLEAALERMKEADVSSLLIIDADGLAGILTNRDLSLAPDVQGTVDGLMTPLNKLVTGKSDITLSEARTLLHEHRVEKLPLIGEDGRLTGLITAQDILKLQRDPEATKDDRGRLRVGAAIGVRASDVERAGACLEAGADLLVAGSYLFKAADMKAGVEALKVDAGSA